MRDSGVPSRTTTITLTIIVTDVNRAPSITSTAPTTATEDQLYTYNVQASDPDAGDVLSYKLTQAPAGATINPTTGRIDWTPGDAAGGRVVDFEVEVCDNKTPPACVKQAWKVNVTNVNDPPRITSTPPTTATEDSPYNYKPTATDPDPNSALTWRFAKDPTGADIAPPGATIDPATGEIKWTPGDADADKEIDFAIEVCDNATPPACTKQSWKTKVTNVNDPPKITSTPPSSGREGIPYNYKPTATDPDPNDKLTWAKKSGPAGVRVDPNTGEVTWTPDASDTQAGSREIEIEVCDNATPPACVTQKWTVAVTRANQAPVITSTPPEKAFVGQDLGYTPTATDPDPNSTLTWRFAKDAAGADIAPPGATIDPTTGKITWTPTANDAGKDIEWGIEVCDNATPPLCVTQRFRTRVERPCQVDADCPTSEICSAKTCRPAGCSNQSTACAADQFCRDGQCLEDICKKGTLTCTAPNFCRPGDTACVGSCAGVSCAATERCRGGLCEKDPCNGVSCQGSTVCVEGQCVTERCNQASVCKHGRLCRPDLQTCQEDICKSITCPQGQLCKDGQCGVDIPCAYDSDCGGEAVCIGKLCKPAGCYKNGCPQGERCKEGACVADPCAGITCPDNGSICRPTDGVCVRVCKAACPRGEVCLDGECKADPCSVVDCGMEARCVLGKCLLEGCFASPNEKCKAQRACAADGCVDDLCKDFVCPSGQICTQGQCQIPSASTEGTIEETTETSSEPAPDQPSEGIQDTTAESANETIAQENVQDGAVTEVTADDQEITNADKGDTQEPSNGDSAGIVGGGCGCQQTDPWFSWFFGLCLFTLFAMRRRKRSV